MFHQLRQPRCLLRYLTWGSAVLISLATAAIAGLGVAILAPAHYSATTSLVLSDRPDIVSTLGGSAQALQPGMGAMAMVGNSRLELLQTVMKSRTVRQAVAMKFAIAKPGTDPAVALGKLTRIRLLGQSGLAVTVTCPAPSRLSRLLLSSAGDEVERARSLCAELGNGYTAELDAYVTDSSVSEAQQNRRFIEGRREDVARRLQQTEAQLADLQMQYAFMDPQSRASALEDQAKILQGQRDEALAQAAGLEHSLRTGYALMGGQTPMRIQQEVTGRSPVVTQLEGNLADLNTRLATELASGKASSHPDVMDIQSAIGATAGQLAAAQGLVRQQLSKQVDPAYDDLRTRLNGLRVERVGAQARGAEYAARVAGLNAQMLALPEIGRQYVTLYRSQQLQSQVLATLTEKLEQARIEEHRQGNGRFHVLDRAEPPLRKSGPSAALVAFGTFCLTGTLLGMALAYREGWLSAM